MNTRLLVYFFSAFFSALGAGVSANLDQEGWIRLIVLSLASAFTAVRAFFDNKPSGGSGATMPLLIFAAVIAALSLTSCSTGVYGADGKLQLKTYADIRGLRFKGPGTSLEVSEMNHSTPTRTAADGVGKTVSALGAAAAGIK